MKNPTPSVLSSIRLATIAVLALLASNTQRVTADPAILLFQDDFIGGIPGWTAVQPAGGAYIDGPMLWVYDKNSDSFAEHSNLYTDAAGFSGSRITSMLIHDTVAPTNFTYTARLTAGDDDAFGLIFGFEADLVFYRVYFARQNRALVGWPFQGWGVDRMNNGQITEIAGPAQTFVNTANQPFDVIISVNNGLLDLTVVDNPLVSPVTNTVATGVSLPTSPSARVGMFSWGQAGGIPRSFRVQNPTLNGVALDAAAEATVLTNWSFLIPPGGTGTTNAASPTGTPLEPVWGYGLDINGFRGTMIENSDWTANNVGPATTNFPAPAAVAGDVNWSNYVYSARFLLSDDDGFGMLLRYQNETNFYRIAFRQQNSQLGIKRGLTVQKNVNLGFEQIYSNAVADFIPPFVGGTPSPFEVHAFIRTNTLQIVAIKNPDLASASSVGSGPIEMTSGLGGSTLDTGKIGIFSWAMYADRKGTEVDWVKVSQVNGEGLLVSSAFGTPDPPIGLNDIPVGTVVTATVQNVVQIQPDVRQVSTGWRGVGSVPATGTINSNVFTLTSFSSITWAWQTQYLLTTNATAGGTITNLNPTVISNWVPANASVSLSAVADPGYIFTGWSGDSLLASSTNLTFPMIRPVTLAAHFALDSDGDGLADAWELFYFGNLSQDGTGDPDGDGSSNLVEFQLGTNPTFAETLTASDGLSSQWTNTCRDPALPGEVTVVDFGSGYRGAFNSNNENKASDVATFIPATQLSNNVSFQTGRLIVRSNVWNTSWGTNFSASWELSVGDNDGNCFYFRYVNESNWFRVTLCGENPVASLTRPFVGLSVQRRTNGFHSDIPLTLVSDPATVAASYTDPTDGTASPPPVNTPGGFKKVRVTVSATNQLFEVRVIGWNAYLGTPDFDPAYELIETFSNDAPNVQGGRIGFAPWGEGGFGNNTNQVNGIPIPVGAFFDNIVIKSPANGPIVFSENWETAALATNLPAGWTNPYTGVTNLQGNWVVNVDGSISQLANQGGNTTGTASDPKADADGNVLLAPDQMSRNYLLQVGFHAFDNDGVGIVYDFQDTNNFSRVMFRQEATFQPDIPPGLSVSRKSGGVWSDITAGDPSFLYTPGRPFEVSLGNNNGDYSLVVRDLENPAAAVTRWHWTGSSAAPTNRFGVTTWFSANAHVLYARAFALPTIVPAVPFKITNISRSGGNVVLDISKPAGSSYHVLRATSVAGPYVTNAANQTAGQYIEPAPVGNTVFYRLQLVP